MSEPTAPRVFISHAGEDKIAYAEPLAALLLAGGVNAWLDKWEMLPGDSLIQKIFSEGIQGTDAVVVMLSTTSVKKPWVQKELNVAAVNNIQKASRLIPLRLDDCVVPEVLLDLLWLDWTKDGGVEGVSTRIVETLHGKSSKPTLGSPPPHLSQPRFSIPGLNARDVKVLEIIFKASLEHGIYLLQANVIMPQAEQEGLTIDQVQDSLVMLEHEGFVTNKDLTMAQRFIVIDLDAGQALRLGQSFGYDVDSLLRRLVAFVCNGQARSLFDLQELLQNFPNGLVEAAVVVLSGNGFWNSSGTINGNLHIYSVTPRAKRWLEENP